MKGAFRGLVMFCLLTLVLVTWEGTVFITELYIFMLIYALSLVILLFHTKLKSNLI